QQRDGRYVLCGELIRDRRVISPGAETLETRSGVAGSICRRSEVHPQLRDGALAPLRKQGLGKIEARCDHVAAPAWAVVTSSWPVTAAVMSAWRRSPSTALERSTCTWNSWRALERSPHSATR